MASSLLAPPQNRKKLEKSTNSSNPQTFETRIGTQKLQSDLPTLCSLQDPQATYLCPYRTSHRQHVPREITEFLTQKIYHISNHFAHTKHQGRVQGNKVG